MAKTLYSSEKLYKVKGICLHILWRKVFHNGNYSRVVSMHFTYFYSDFIFFFPLKSIKLVSSHLFTDYYGQLLFDVEFFIQSVGKLVSQNEIEMKTEIV